MADAWAMSIRRYEHGLRLRFARPMWQIHLTLDKARELGSALLVAAEGREPLDETEGGIDG